MKKITFVFLMCAIALITSCAKTNPIAGTWVAKESLGINHYLEFDSSGGGIYYFESEITGTSSPMKFTYELTEYESDLLNDEVSFNASSSVDGYASIVMDGELISPTILRCSSINASETYSLTFKKQE